MSVRSVFALCSFDKSQKKEIQGHSSPFFTRAFSFTKNGEPLAVGSGSAGLILLLS